MIRRNIALLIFVLGISMLPAKGNVSLVMPHLSGSQGTQLTIPVRVADFDDIISMQGTIQFDPAVVSYVSVQQYGLPGMNASNFGTSLVGSGKLTFSWFDGTFAGVSLADSSVVFSITFQLNGSAGQSSAVTFSGIPTLIEVIDHLYNTVATNLQHGSISISGSGPAADITLFLDTVSGAQGSQVAVSLRALDFININSLQGTLEWNTSVATYVGLGSFGLPGMNAGNFGTSQTGSGKLMFSWSDLLLLGQDMPDSAALFTVLFNLSGPPATQTPVNFINTPVIPEVVDSAFQVLNADLLAGSISITPVPGGNISIFCDSVEAPTSSYVDVRMRATGFTDVIGAQGTLQFSTAVVQFDSIVAFGLPDMSTASFGLSQTGSGKIMWAWNDPTLAGVSIPDSSILFTMRFYVTGSMGSFTNLEFIDAPTPQEYVDKNYQVLNESLTPGRIDIIGSGDIITHDPATLNFCPGDTFSVAFTVNGTFLPGNLFILQVSDPTGSFITALNLDTIAGTGSGVFHATLPLSALPGSAYRLRVISTNPFVTGMQNPGAISVLAIPGQAAIPSGTAQLCRDAADEVYSSSATNATTYSWFLFPPSAGSISGTSATATVNWDAGFSGTAAICVFGSNGSCPGALSDTLYVEVLEYPAQPSMPSGDTIFCQGLASGLYTVPTLPGADSYVWNLSPAAAGSLTGSNDTITISWNTAFNGEVSLSVSAVNSICTGNASDSLLIHILPVPASPGIPSGDTLLCVNPANTVYTSPVVAGAIAYNWVLLPPVAGLLTPSGNSVSIDWNDTWTGTASLFTAAVNASCQGPDSDTLLIVIQGLPGQAAVPSGDTLLCEGAGNTEYTTAGSAGASSYLWAIIPPAAGSLSGTGDTVLVSWTPGWTGTAGLTVAGNHICGSGSVSDTLFVTLLSYPAVPSLPSGDSVICQGSPPSGYSISPIAGADSYQWNIVPPSAGSISGSGNAVTLTWNPAFSGTASLSVSAVNVMCGSAYSAALSIDVLETPVSPAIPAGDQNLCPDAPNTPYTVTPVSGATDYSWVLLPPAAGTVIPAGTSAMVDWDAGFTGQASLFVYAMNGSCPGNSSDTLLITVSNLPGPAAAPSGLDDFCTGEDPGTYSTAGASGATSYNWGLEPPTAGTVTGSGSTVSISWTPGWSGTAWLFVAGVNACGTGTYSDSLGITVHPLPAAPVISQNGGMLSSSYTVSNQWYYNGNPVSGAIAQDYTPPVNGNYFVIYTDTNGCWSSSDTIAVNFVGIAEGLTAKPIIYPNPAEGVFFIDFPDCVCIRLLDLQGRCFMEINEPDTRPFRIDAGHLCPGTYILQISNTQGVQRLKLMIE